MIIGKLNSQMLKEMQLSFQLTEERELASGRRKPGKPMPTPVAFKPKTIAKTFSAPAETLAPKKEHVVMETPPKSNKSKGKAAQKRPVAPEESKLQSSPSIKKPKRDDTSPAKNSKVKSKSIAAQKDKVAKAPLTTEKQIDSGLKNHKKGSKQQAIKVPKKSETNPAKSKVNSTTKTKGFKVTNVQVISDKSKTPRKGGESRINSQKGQKSKAWVLEIPKKNESLDAVDGHSEKDLEAFDIENYDMDSMNSEDDWAEEGDDSMEIDSEVDEHFFKKPKIFKVKSKGDQNNILDLPAPFEESLESHAHLLQGDGKGVVRKIEVFENALAEFDSDDEDYEPQESDDFVSEEFDSEDSGSDEDLDSEDCEDFDSDEDFDSEDSDSDDFDSDIFDSDDLDSTYEPPDIDGFFDDPPLGLQKEPLIIEEIFDDPSVDESQKELVRYKSKANKNVKESTVVEEIVKDLTVVNEIVEDSTVVEEIVEDPTVVDEIVEESINEVSSNTIGEPEVPMEIEDNADNVTPDKEPVSQPSETPFYRNPQANPTEHSVFENSLKSNHVLAVIKEDLELYGTLVLTLLSGQLSVNGYRARRQEPLTIYSPKGLNWVAISPSKTKKPAKDEVNWEELNKNFSRAQLDRIQGCFQKQTNAIVLLQQNTGAQRLVENFGKHMAQNLFPLINSSNRPFHQSESLLHCLIQSSDLSRTLQVPQVWNKLKMQATSRILIAGGKGVGKSSLLRYLINRNLGQFPSLLLIDLDIGQPEIFVPQTVSCILIDEPLLGPGFLFNKQPDHAYVVGHTNIVLCAEQYARAVIQLIQNVQKDAKYANIPWLINTMGYNKGFGTELMALLVDRIRPTDLVQIASPVPINNFDSPLEWSSLSQLKPIIYTSDEFRVKDVPKYTLHKLLSAVPPKERGTWSLSAKDMRYSNLLARLSSCLTGNAKSLTDCQPLGVSLESLKILHSTSEDYSSEELIHGMEGNVVYLCNQGAGLPQCLGIGVVRAIDYKRKQLFLVPAMPSQRMSLVDCLILGGELTLPQGYFKDQGQMVASSVPFVFILDDSKSSKSIQQIYHRTPAFLGVPVNQRN
ncbi:polynucleotide 5'-hydroxyl-kinase NOL9 isoform X2 [Drosophila gunungcola]|uniref:polynucleotide 5'-hydroxyl-kinase NOL9 isoform X2 n=1 Tax=Drosophila gunungcola TaxID=103775 RepID=UPI0022E4001F|nr:polynucleotide 5'-hydroxyl-kinase NOL9 isoform X2 [Drosophila gunungcola]